MSDFAVARDLMIEGQVKPNRATDPRLLAALRAIPREAFVPASLKAVAYVDEDIKIAPGRHLMEPRVLSRLIQALEVGADDLALDIGGGSGYSAAVLSKLAGAVVAVEEDAALAAQAEKLLAGQGCDNAVVVCGPLAQGCPSQGPYDAIFINGAVEEAPEALLQQLKEGGRLAAVVMANGVGKAMLYLKSHGVVGRRELFDASVPPLPGFALPKKFVF